MHFDWSTLILQTVNVLVLLWLLRRFLFRPIVGIIAERKAAAEKLLAEAAATCEQAKAQADQAAQRDKALAADREQILADARAAAETERAALLNGATAEAARARDLAQASLDQQREQMRHELEAGARQLAVAIASRLLERVPAPALNAAVLESLNALSPDHVQALAAPGEALEVVTSAPLDPAIQAMVRQRLSGLSALHFSTDPSLILGIELRGTHATLCNNWRADLDRIAEELSQDDKQLSVA